MKLELEKLEAALEERDKENGSAGAESGARHEEEEKQ